MNKKIKELPKWVQEIVFERQKEQGNEPNSNVYLCDLNNKGNFMWDKTNEGYGIWVNVLGENFQPLAEFHGITIDEQSEKVGEVDYLDKMAEDSSEVQEATYATQHKLTYKHGFKDGYNKAKFEVLKKLEDPNFYIVNIFKYLNEEQMRSIGLKLIERANNHE